MALRRRVTQEVWPRVADQQPGFAGGLNTTASDFSLGPTQVRQAENARLTQVGDIKKRGGTQRMHASALATSILNGFCWRTAGAHEYLVVANSLLYSGGTYAIPMTWTAKVGAMSASQVPDFVAFRDGSGECCYIADGGPLNKYTGGALSVNLAGTPNATRLAVYNARLYGITGASDDLYWSALNDGDTLGVVASGGGSATIRTFSNQQITALLTLRESLAIFHVAGISRWQGLTQDDISVETGVRGFSSDTGTIAPRSVIGVEGIGYFLSELGAYAITDSGVTPLDTPEKPDPTASLLAALSAADFAEIDAVHHKAEREIWWYIPGSGVFVYNYRINAWSGPFTGTYTDEDTAVSCLFDGVDADGVPIVLAGGADGYLRRTEPEDVFADDLTSAGAGGTAYTMRVKCRRFFTTAPEAEKAFRWAVVMADLNGSDAANLSWTVPTGQGGTSALSTDDDATWGSFVWGTFVWGGGGVKPYRVPVAGRGSHIDITITDAGESGSVWSRVSLDATSYGVR